MYRVGKSLIFATESNKIRHIEAKNKRDVGYSDTPPPTPAQFLSRASGVRGRGRLWRATLKLSEKRREIFERQFPPLSL